MWLKLDSDGNGAGPEQLLLRLESIAQYVTQLQGVLGAEGIDGISGALTIARHLQETLGDFSADEIARVRAELRACQGRLAELAARVEGVRALKQRIAAGE